MKPTFEYETNSYVGIPEKWQDITVKTPTPAEMYKSEGILKAIRHIPTWFRYRKHDGTYKVVTIHTDKENETIKVKLTLETLPTRFTIVQSH